MRHAALFAAPMMACSLAVAAPITTGDLVKQTVDLEALSAFPDPPFKVTQFSSYDRHSVAPYAPGWYANNDGFGGEDPPNFLEVLEEPNAEGIGRYLMVDAPGPGAMVRTWTAAINGDLTVYLDGADEPLYDGPAQEFLQYTYSVFARQLGLIDENVERGFHQSFGCYFPVSFAERLRIEWTGNLRRLHFYQIEVRRYPDGADVRSFEPEDVRRYADEIAEALPILAATDANWSPPGDGGVHEIDAAVEPGESAELLKLEEGSGAIQELTLRIDEAAPHTAYRQVILKAYFDGSPKPQIESPLGDFFGAGPGISPYDSLPMTVRSDESMTCRFVMPYQESVLLAVENLGEQAARVVGSANVLPTDWDGDRSLHLHAKWQVDHDLVAAGGDGAQDMPFLSARGKGVYVGTAVQLFNPVSVPTPGGNWWGEGDEKVWVDDDEFPSLFGTGSEDYFNYAWSSPDLFWFAYCGQPLNTGPGNRGFVTNVRWHILDPLPFSSRIDFFMELMSHTPTPNFSYGRIAYLYAAPTLRDAHVTITRADVTQALELPENWEPVAAGQARGATFFQAEDIAPEGAPGVEIIDGRMWSRGKLLEWAPQGDQVLEMKVQAPEDGTYQLVMTVARRPNSGRFAVEIDGQPLQPEVDLHETDLTMLRNVFFSAGDPAAVELEAGEHVVRLIPRGRNEASDGDRIGIDFVWLLPR